MVRSINKKPNYIPYKLKTRQFEKYTVLTFRCLKDNYAYAIVDNTNKEAVLIDPVDADGIFRVLTEMKIRVLGILNTHRHWDHSSGNWRMMNLARKPMDIIMSSAEYDSMWSISRYITKVNKTVEDIQEFYIGRMKFKAIYSPWHTIGHCMFLFNQTSLFTGDAIFSNGIGKFFEGRPADFYCFCIKFFDPNSKSKLNEETLFWPGHEYSKVNSEFNGWILDKLEPKSPIKEDSYPALFCEQKETNLFIRACFDRVNFKLWERLKKPESLPNAADSLLIRTAIKFKESKLGFDFNLESEFSIVEKMLKVRDPTDARNSLLVIWMLRRLKDEFY